MPGDLSSDRGAFYSTGTYFSGTYIESRISNIARSDDWIKAEFYALRLELHTIGIEENLPVNSTLNSFFFGMNF